MQKRSTSSQHRTVPDSIAGFCQFSISSGPEDSSADATSGCQPIIGGIDNAVCIQIRNADFPDFNLAHFVCPRLIIHIVPIVLCIFKVVKIIVMIVVKILCIIVVPGSVLILVVVVMAAVRISASRRFSCGGRCRGGSGCLHISGLGRCSRSGRRCRPRRYRYNVGGSWPFGLLWYGSPITSTKQANEYHTYQYKESHLFVHFNFLP